MASGIAERTQTANEFNEIYSQIAAPIGRCTLLLNTCSKLQDTIDKPAGIIDQQDALSSKIGKMGEVADMLENIHPSLIRLKSVWETYSKFKPVDKDPVPRRFATTEKNFNAATEKYILLSQQK